MLKMSVASYNCKWAQIWIPAKQISREYHGKSSNCACSVHGHCLRSLLRSACQRSLHEVCWIFFMVWYHIISQMLERNVADLFVGYLTLLRERYGVIWEVTSQTIVPSITSLPSESLHDCRLKFSMHFWSWLFMLQQGRPPFFVEGPQLIWFAVRTCKNRNKWNTWPRKL